MIAFNMKAKKAKTVKAKANMSYILRNCLNLSTTFYKNKTF